MCATSSCEELSEEGRDIHDMKPSFAFEISPVTSTRRNADSARLFIFGLSTFCLKIIYRFYVSPGVTMDSSHGLMRPESDYSMWCPITRPRFVNDSARPGLGGRMAQRPARLTRCGEVLRPADRSVIDHGDQTFEGAKLSFFRPNQSVEIGYSATAGASRCAHCSSHSITGSS